MSPNLRRLIPVAATLLVACGGEAPETASRPAKPDPEASRAATPAIDACSLLTSDEVESVTGWRIAKAEPSAAGSTATCTLTGPEGFTQTVSLVVAPGMPAMAGSVQMAEWRKKQGESYGDVKFIIRPVEGLGVPAISNEIEGVGLATVEMAVNGMMVDVTTPKLAASKQLAAKAVGRVR
jgi:hypothetical protein